MIDRVGSIVMADVTRAEFGASVAERDLRALAANPRVRVLQCSAPVPDRVWGLVDAAFFAARPDVELRVYGHYSEPCDLGFAGRMTRVRRFAADCLARAANVDAIADLPPLESLSLGIYEAQDFRVLERVAPSLTSLSLHATRSKKPSLAPLARFAALKRLYLEGQSNGIDVLGGLGHLEEITLRSITTPDLAYLSPLEKLWSLDIKLGGIRSFAGIEGKAGIKYLELWQIRELRGVGVIAELPGLQNLFLQSLPLIAALPGLAASRALRRIGLENLKGLADFGALEAAPALEEFWLAEGGRQQPEQLLPVLRNPAVVRASAWFGSDRRNQAFARLRDAHGKAAFDLSMPFVYL